MGTYDTRGGSPLHDPAADMPDPPCQVCGGFVDDGPPHMQCDCPQCLECASDPAEAKCYHEHEQSVHFTHSIPLYLQRLVRDSHRCSVAQGWWHDLHTGKPLDRNVGELLILIVSEIAEAMEAHRKDLNDSHLPHRPGIEVELADAIIRICDLAGGLNLDLGGAVLEKLRYNAQRADHKPENRRQAGGKAY